MVIIGNIRRLLLLMVGIGGAMCMAGILLGINQMAYVQFDSKEPLLQVQPTEREGEISFPFAVPGTSLVAEALVYYDGPFLEDASNVEMFNSVALLLRNESNKGIAQAEIVISGNENWRFQAAYIPPMGTVLVLECTGAEFTDLTVTSCTGWDKAETGEWDVERLLRIDSIDMGTVAVTNITETELANIRLLYKNWLPQNEIFVGGITYEIEIERLLAGQTVMLQPEHYAQGYSRFIKISADEI